MVFQQVVKNSKLGATLNPCDQTFAEASSQALCEVPNRKNLFLMMGLLFVGITYRRVLHIDFGSAGIKGSTTALFLAVLLGSADRKSPCVVDLHSNPWPRKH